MDFAFDSILSNVEPINPPNDNERIIEQLIDIKIVDDIIPQHDINNIYNDEINIKDDNARHKFKSEILYMETDVFTKPISTTYTMEGLLSNVNFNEKDLIEFLTVNEDIVVCRCNFGRIQYSGYTEPIKQRTSNRGRKKKEKIKKPRQKQGMGTDFNSQISFYVRSLLNRKDKYIISPDEKIYKFKVFRNGKIQLPGAREYLADDIILCIDLIIRLLNKVLNLQSLHDIPTENSLVQLININPVMKNYKFEIKRPSKKHIIDLSTLKLLLINEDGDAPTHPPIFLIKYTPQSTNIAIKFLTPISKNAEKTTRICIFRKGKINILGAFHIDVTNQICVYLDWVIKKYYNKIIVISPLITH